MMVVSVKVRSIPEVVEVIDELYKELDELRCIVDTYIDETDASIGKLNINFESLELEIVNVNKKIEDLTDSVNKGLDRNLKSSESTGVNVESLINKIIEMDERQDEREEARKDRNNKLLTAIIGTGILSPAMLLAILEIFKLFIK